MNAMEMQVMMIVGFVLDPLLGWRSIVRPIQSLEPTITCFQPGDDLADTDHHGNSVSEIRTARRCYRKTQKEQIHHPE